MPVQVDTIHADTAPKSSWWSGFWQGISTEFFGAVVTIILLGLGVVVFEQYQDIQNRKAALILQMGSDERVWAVEATRQLNALGWLEDGTLTRVDLQYADLTDANLGRANLTHTNLERANLTDANLGEAKLTDANLAYGNLTDTFLVNADLTNAYLLGVNLTDANLEYADLTGAYLEYANLTGARFSENTILPDNTNWTPDSDLTRFTDPDHPDFWDICVRDTIRPWYC